MTPDPEPAAASRPRRRSVGRIGCPRTAAIAGLRIGTCLAAATGVSLALWQPDHSFWIAMTVAVIVRPEYASVFVRTVNRVVGTVVGAVLAATLLMVVGPGPPVAIAAAVALGAAVLTAPRLYAWNVVGVTASALLSASLAGDDPVLPALRVLDTLLGAGIAVVLGYLMWPGARRPATAAPLAAAISGARAYLVGVQARPSDDARLAILCDRAYRLAHRARETAVAALLEPPPHGVGVEKTVTAAADLEDVVDLITAVRVLADPGRPASVDRISARLDALEQVAAAAGR